MDLDNMKLYFGNGGTWVNSGDPESGATGTGTQPYFGGASNSANATDVDTYGFAIGLHNSSVTQANFGNGYFGTTTAGTETDASGIGLFKYEVPDGYNCLCTKNIITYG